MLTQFGHKNLKTSNLEQGFLCQWNRCILDISFSSITKTSLFVLILQDLLLFLSFSFPKDQFIH